MRRYRCERCGSHCRFDAVGCPTCAAPLGYRPDRLDLRVLHPGPSEAEFLVRGSEEALFRCLNAAWGCNWMLPADGAGVWCRSCRLTRGRPDTSDGAALAAWSEVEGAKRHLIHQLDALGLPIEERSPERPEGLAFDLVHLPGRPQVTGYHGGIVTIDLTEADSRVRDDLRRRFGEPLRTLIGHLRHEIGHYFWSRLVPPEDPVALDSFRARFGDERADYGVAIAAHHRGSGPPDDGARHITAYARAHPLEDWAETFAHYLHIRDALESAEAFDLVTGQAEPAPGRAGAPTFEQLLVRWHHVADGVDAVAASLGAAPVYPLRPSGLTVAKLAFVHERIGAAAVGRSSGGGEAPGGDAGGVDPDPWGEAVADFLADLLDNVVVEVRTDGDRPSPGHRPAVPHLGSDGRRRQFSFVPKHELEPDGPGPTAFPEELADLPDAALRAMNRALAPEPGAVLPHPSMARAIHEVIVAEVLADRLATTGDDDAQVSRVARVIAETLSYFSDLAATSLEGRPVSHGVVLVSGRHGDGPLHPAVRYPGHLPSRKRTPLLFDGIESVLVVSDSGLALRSMGRSELTRSDGDQSVALSDYEAFPGPDGALTAAASDAFGGVGVHLRADRSTWIFVGGEPMFVRRANHWKSIALASFTQAVRTLGSTSPELAQSVTRAALRLSVEGHGGLLAIAPDARAVAASAESSGRVPGAGRSGDDPTVDDDLRRAVASGGTSVEDLVRLGRIDGATVVDRQGQVLAFGAIVRSTGSAHEGARTAAAQALSLEVDIALCVSQDGPITLFHRGRPVLEVL